MSDREFDDDGRMTRYGWQRQGERREALLNPVETPERPESRAIIREFLERIEAKAEKAARLTSQPKPKRSVG
jgi:hypothetical protein